MLNLPARFWLATSSLTPLFLICFVRMFPVMDEKLPFLGLCTENATTGLPIPTLPFALAILFAMAVLIGVLVAFGLFKNMSKVNKVNIPIVSIHNRDSELTAYLVSYLLPFLDKGLTDPRIIISILLYLATVIVVAVYTNMIHINPLLALRGYHVFDIMTNDQKSATIISNDINLSAKQTIAAAKFVEGVYWHDK